MEGGGQNVKGTRNRRGGNPCCHLAFPPPPLHVNIYPRFHSFHSLIPTALVWWTHIAYVLGCPIIPCTVRQQNNEHSCLGGEPAGPPTALAIRPLSLIAWAVPVTIRAPFPFSDPYFFIKFLSYRVFRAAIPVPAGGDGAGPLIGCCPATYPRSFSGGGTVYPHFIISPKNRLHFILFCPVPTSFTGTNCSPTSDRHHPN